MPRNVIEIWHARQSSVFASLLFSFLSMLLIPLLLNIALLVTSQQALNGQIAASQTAQLNQTSGEFNGAYSKASALLYVVSTQRLLSDYGAAPSRNYFSEYEIRLYLDMMMANQSYIKQLYIYMPKYDYVLYSSGGANSERFVSAYYPDLSTEEWKQLVATGDNTLRRLFLPEKEENPYADTLLAQSMWMKGKDAESPVVVMHISNQQLLMSSLRNELAAPDGVMVYSDSALLASSISRRQAWQAYTGNHEAENGYVRISSVRSPENGVTVAYLSNPSIKHDIGLLRELWLLSILVSIAVTMVLGIRMSSKHSRKVQSIVAMLEKKPNQTDLLVSLNQSALPDRALEPVGYGRITDMVTEYIRDYNALSAMIKDHGEQLVDVYAEKIFSGSETDRAAMLATLRLYGYEFDGGFYRLCVLAGKQGKRVRALPQLLEDMRASLRAANVTAVYAAIAAQYENTLICLIHWYGRENERAARPLVADWMARLPEGQKASLELAESAPYADIADTRAVYRELMKALASKDKAKRPQDDFSDDWVGQSMRLISELYADKSLSTSMIAERLGLTRSYLSAYFKKATGRGLHEEIQRCRIEAAKRLMAENPRLQIAEVADLVGFNNAESFIRNFKIFEGMTPGQYRD